MYVFIWLYLLIENVICETFTYKLFEQLLRINNRADYNCMTNNQVRCLIISVFHFGNYIVHTLLLSTHTFSVLRLGLHCQFSPLGVSLVQTQSLLMLLCFRSPWARERAVRAWDVRGCASVDASSSLLRHSHPAGHPRWWICILNTSKTISNVFN